MARSNDDGQCLGDEPVDELDASASSELIIADEPIDDAEGATANARSGGRPERQGPLRCHLMNALLWYLTELDPESYECLVGACAACLPRAAVDADEPVDIAAAIHRVVGDAQRADVLRTFAVSHTQKPRHAGQALETVAAWLALELDLFEDATTTRHLASKPKDRVRAVANRFRQAKDWSLRHQG